MKALAVDAGATHCRVAFVTAQEHVSIAIDGANAFSDLDGAARAIVRGVETLAGNIDSTVDELIALPTYIGAAGVIDSAVAKELSLRLPFSKLKIEEDRVNALRGALGERDGYVVHCGTGSFFAARKNGNSVFAGGWGPVIDDLGSAYWLSIQAMQMTVYAEDGLETHSELTRCILADYASAAGIAFHAKNSTTGEIGLLAKKITDYADRGDQNAISLLRKAAAVIEEKLQQFGWNDGDAVCLTGGVGERYKAYLSKPMQVCQVDAAGEPLEGAVALSREYYKELNP